MENNNYAKIIITVIIMFSTLILLIGSYFLIDFSMTYLMGEEKPFIVDISAFLLFLILTVMIIIFIISIVTNFYKFVYKIVETELNKRKIKNEKHNINSN